MGWLHAINGGLGTYLKRSVIKDENFQKKVFSRIDKELLLRMFPKAPKEGLFDEYEKYSEDAKILLAGSALGSYYNYSIRSEYWQLSAEELNELGNKLGEYEYTHTCVSLLGVLFSAKYGYPLGAFRSVSDYNDDCMLYCTLRFPPHENAGDIRNLTYELYEKRLKEFLGELGYTEEIEIEYCEEYIKE